MKKFILALSLLLTGTAQAQRAYLDSTFNKTGYQEELVPPTASITDVVYPQKLVPQADGKTLVLLTTRDTMTLVRLLPDGTVDPGFATAGVFRYSGTSGSSAQWKGTDVALQPDGKILFMGYTYATGQLGYSVLLRLDPSGALDAGFGSGGVATLQLPPVSGTQGAISSGEKILIRPSGKILIAGTHATLPAYSRRFLLAQYASDGKPDLSFGVNGAVVTAPDTASVSTTDALLMPDGKVVIAGGQSYTGKLCTVVARYDASGQPDVGFDGDGWAQLVVSVVDSNCLPYSMVMQANGSVVVGLDYLSKGDRIYAKRLTVAGTVDSSFGINGLMRYILPGIVEIAPRVLMLAGGDSLLFGAQTGAAGSLSYDYSIARATPDGLADSRWGAQGMIQTDFHGAYEDLRSLAVQGDGKILVGGVSDSDRGGTSVFRANVARYKLIRRAPIAVEAPVGPSSAAIQIYPNPARGTCTVQSHRPVTVQIRRTGGALVQQLYLHAGNQYTAVVSGLAPGVYFIGAPEGGKGEKLVVIP